MIHAQIPTERRKLPESRRETDKTRVLQHVTDQARLLQLETALQTVVTDAGATYREIGRRGTTVISLGQYRRLAAARKVLEAK